MIWVVVIAGLVALVFIHELGHFGVALLVGMRPRSFYIGFPPALVKIKRRGIEYGIGMIPAGGFVRIPGMHRPAARDVQIFMGPAIEEVSSLAPAALAVRRALASEDYDGARVAYAELEEEVTHAMLSARARRSAARALRDVEEGTSDDAYWRSPVWKRVAVIAAGPLANVLVAFLILFILYATSGAPTSQATTTVAQVQAGRPAASAGLRSGDRVVAVDGQRAATYRAVSKLIRASDGGAITVTVVRDGRRVTLGPAPTVQSDGRWIWGFAFAPKTAHYSIGGAARTAGVDLGHTVSGTVAALGGLFAGHTHNLSGPVQIVQVSHSALQDGATYYLELLALLSMSLALLNLLPMLPLDGGHILFSVVEGIRRRAVAREIYERVSVVGIALILLVYMIAFSNGTH